MKNIFYFRELNKIGGVEQFFYYLSKKYKNRDITIYYKTADVNQLNRLKKYARCTKYQGEKIECEKAYFNYFPDIINQVEAKEYIQVIHADYTGKKYSINPKITKFIAVSKVAAEGFKNTTGIEAEVIYNPLSLEKPKRVLNLISATRLSPDKGRKRMIELSKIMDQNNIPYMWTIFTDKPQAINNPNFIYMKPRLDIIDYIANADYLVQLSDAEAYCYSIVEALSVGTPVIATDIPVMQEIGLINGKNGFIVDLDMKNVPIKEIYESRLKFEYKPKQDTWGKELAKGESTYKTYTVRATKAYKELHLTDGVLGFIPEEGYEFIVDEDRLKELQNNKQKIKFIDIVEEV